MYRLGEFSKLYDSPQMLPDLCRFVSDDDTWCGPTCYPLAWALTHYLWREHPTRLAGLLQAAVAKTSRGGAGCTLSHALQAICYDGLMERFHETAHQWPTDGTPGDASVQTRPAPP